MAIVYPSPKGAQVTETFGYSGNLPGTVNSFYTVPVQDGFAGIAFTIANPGTGSTLFEGTFDGSTWFGATMRSTSSNGYTNFATGTDTFLGSIVGMRSMRFRVTAPGAGSGTVAGTVQRFVHTLEGQENGPPTDFETSLAANLIPGESIVNKYGRTTSVGGPTVPQDIWDGGGVYNGFPATPDYVQVLSSNSGDSIVGWGLRTVMINGLDANWATKSETITLSGATPITSVNQFYRVNTAVGQSAGVSGVNIGTIFCRQSGTPSNVFFAMPTGTNNAFVCAYTVPAGKTAYIRNIRASCSIAAQLEVALRTRGSGMLWRNRKAFDVNNLTPFEEDIYGGISLPTRSDVVLRVTQCSTSGAAVRGELDLILLDA